RRRVDPHLLHRADLPGNDQPHRAQRRRIQVVARGRLVGRSRTGPRVLSKALRDWGFRLQHRLPVRVGVSKLTLTMACWNYDRTRGLLEGRIPVEGVELNYLNLTVEEIFFRMLRNREFEVAEMSLSSYTLSLFQENPPFIAIPVFPSRYFRHSCIFVNTQS